MEKGPIYQKKKKKKGGKKTNGSPNLKLQFELIRLGTKIYQTQTIIIPLNLERDVVNLLQLQIKYSFPLIQY